MTTRYTVEMIASGQPRAYADSRTHCRVTLECTSPFTNESKELAPWFVNEATIKAILPGLRCGFVLTTKVERTHGLDTYLDWLRPIDKTTADKVRKYGKPDEIVGSIWEFYVVQPFCD